jgi:Leucine-rich repeat (LRR) protein
MVKADSTAAKAESNESPAESLQTQFLQDILPLPSVTPRVPQRPGAYAQRGLAGYAPVVGSHCRNNEESNSEEHSGASCNTRVDNGLVEAWAVSDEEGYGSRDLEEAVPVSENDPNKKNAQEKDWNILSRTLAGVVILAVLLTVVLLVLSSKGAFKKRQSREDSANLVTPTLAPSLSSEEFFASLLPGVTRQVIHMDPTSAQSQALQWLLQDPNYTSYTKDRLLQRFALATFYYSTKPDALSWTRDDDWLDYNVHECQWYLTSHVDLLTRQLVLEDSACNEEETYVRLWLYNNTLAGSLPNELVLLSHLESLDLVSNPALGGTLPTHLAEMTRLTHIGFRKNALTATMPSELGLMTQLTALYVAEQSMVGTFPIQVFRQLTNLEQLAFAAIGHTGTIPTEIGLLTNMVALAIVGTSLTGTIPTEMGSMSSLAYILMFMNQLRGSLPSQLGQLEELKWLNFGQNSLTGTLPSQVGRLWNLQELVLGGNQLSSSLPTEFGQWEHLYKMDLGGNRLSSVVPTELGNLSELIDLSLAGGELVGWLPSELGQLSLLEHLDLSKNNLTGLIPSNLGALEKLKEIFLNGNSFSGTLPSEMGLLRDTLCRWCFSNNSFSSDETWSFLAEQNLTGVPHG